MLTSAAWLQVATPEAGYADAVVADMTRIAGSAKGRALLRDIRASKRTVLIDKPGRLRTPNAWVRPNDLRAATAACADTGTIAADGTPVLGTGEGSDCYVIYDPRQWPNPVHQTIPRSDVLLFCLLRQALSQLRGGADPVGAIPLEVVAEYRT